MFQSERKISSRNYYKASCRKYFKKTTLKVNLQFASDGMYEPLPNRYFSYVVESIEKLHISINEFKKIDIPTNTKFAGENKRSQRKQVS